jgi:hypothetical protein
VATVQSCSLTPSTSSIGNDIIGFKAAVTAKYWYHRLLSHNTGLLGIPGAENCSLFEDESRLGYSAV